MATYAEYCPIAAGAECLADRWTLLILREMMLGAHRFNDIHRGIPRISRTLLSQRLRTLVNRGILERAAVGGHQEYHLTAAGRDLEEVVWSVGNWAVRWAFLDPEDNELDIAWVVWQLHRRVHLDLVPTGRTTVEFRATGAKPGRAWLVTDHRNGATGCEIDPGYEVDLVVSGDNHALHRWYSGRTPWRREVGDGLIEVHGPTRLVRAFPNWIAPNPFAEEIARTRAAARRGG
ncbi:MAG TPA: helix-turn-helix domain-containing protein [Sporichthyaceae bacterium]